VRVRVGVGLRVRVRVRLRLRGRVRLGACTLVRARVWAKYGLNTRVTRGEKLVTSPGRRAVAIYINLTYINLTWPVVAPAVVQ